MPSARRVRLLLFGVVAVVVITLVYTSQLRAAEEHDSRTIKDFYHLTKSGLERAHGGAGKQTVLDSKDKGDGGREEDGAQVAKDMQARLKAAEQKAKDSANAKVLRPDHPAQVIGVGSSAGGQKKMSKIGDDAEAKETDEDHQVETTINDILKRSPVIIFSKTTCPFSKRAKGLLLEKYSISPEPYVVELDTHALGRQIQDRLGQMTGRKTVPNIMVNGKSIGGSDEIAAMDKENGLTEKIRSLGSVGGKTLEIKDRFTEQRS